MRSDSIGLFWQDLPRKGKDRIARVMPPIPDTGWQRPTEYPNLSAAKALSYDVETYDPHLLEKGPGWARHDGHIVGLAVGTEDGHRWYFPMRHTVEPDWNLDPSHVLLWANDTLTDNRPKVVANGTYDMGWLREEGVLVKGPHFDVEFAEALLSEFDNVSLDDLGEKYLGEGKTTSLLYEWSAAYYGGNATWKQRANIYRCPPRLVGPYAQGDVDLPFRVLAKQWPLLHSQGLLPVFDLENRLIPLMIEMRFAGVTINLEYAEELRAQMKDELKEIDSQLYQMVGFEIETTKADSIAKAFDGFGITYPMTPKTKKPSFPKGYLETVDHPVAELITKRRNRQHLVGTFLESYLIESHVNGKVHGSFNQVRGEEHGARPGRFSASYPNLQNIPKRSKIGKLIRNCFIPDYGHQDWIKADYSQIEYRGLAHYAVGPGADDVRSKYINDPTIDFHRMVQALIKQIINQEFERELVKNVNFGTVYGMSVKGLARYIKVPKRKAQELLDAINDGAPFLRTTMQATMDEAEALGYITTILGRRTRYDLWVPSAWNEDAKALPWNKAVLAYVNPKRAYLHKALNNRLQGSAADLIKMAMLMGWESGAFNEVGVPRLTVHDELDFSNPGGKEEVWRYIKHTMENAIQFRVPVQVGWEVGPSWGQAVEIAA